MSNFEGEEQRFGGRVYLRIDPVEAEEGDVLQYTTGNYGRRTHRVSDRRGGRKAAVCVRLHKHEGGKLKWVTMRSIDSCWRRRTNMQAAS